MITWSVCLYAEAYDYVSGCVRMWREREKYTHKARTEYIVGINLPLVTTYVHDTEAIFWIVGLNRNDADATIYSIFDDLIRCADIEEEKNEKKTNKKCCMTKKNKKRSQKSIQCTVCVYFYTASQHSFSSMSVFPIFFLLNVCRKIINSNY